MKIHQLDERARKSAEDTEVQSFITEQKQAFSNSYHVDPNATMKLNKLCGIEDWDNHEVQQIIPKLQDIIYIIINAKVCSQENRARSTEKIRNGHLG